MLTQITGLPGIGTARQQNYRCVRKSDAGRRYLEAGRIIKGSASRDPTNTSYIYVLQPGLVMGKQTSGGAYAPSILGLTAEALSSDETALDLPEVVGDELVRRVGASGTFKLTGPATAGGTVRTLTVTYSAVAAAGGGVRVATITALGVSQVEQINFNIASTAGNLQLNIQKPDGTFATTGSAAWNATDATYLAAINTVLDAATGVAGAIVASAIPAVDTDLGIRLTYTHTSYPNGASPAEVNLFPTSSTAAVYTPVTTAVDGRFVTASFVQPTDGSETPLCLVDDGDGIRVTDMDGNSQDQPFPLALIGGSLVAANIINYPSDSALKTWLKGQLNSTNAGAGFTFDDGF